MPVYPGNVGGGGEITTVANGSVNAPGVSTTIATTGTLAAGSYRLFFLYTITGAVEIQAMNLALVYSNTNQAQLPTGAGVGAVYSGEIPAAVITTSVNAFIIRTVAAATALTVYTAYISATRIA